MGKKLISPTLLMLALAATVGRAADLTWIRAAYYDTKYASAWGGAGTATANALAAAGYTLLNANELKTWMDARIADKKLSVVVMTQDVVPNTVGESMTANCTIRKYLDAGGKVVWYADWPFYYVSDATATRTTWGGGGATAVLGFNAATGPNDSMNVVTLTPDGIKWGLTQTWQSQRPTSPTVTPNLTVLAKDNAGNAAAWVKHYLPNDKFRGFVRFRDTSGQANVEDILRLAEYIDTKASAPQPADGATNVNMPLLQWAASSFALFHNVYLGTTPDLTQANLVSPKQPFTMYYAVQGLEAGVTYYWRIDEVEADGTVRAGDMWQFTVTPKTAWAPKPGDGAAYVVPNVVLQWSAGMNVATHDVYFGADRAAVEAGAPETRKVTGQPATSYTPTGLENGKTYYWRVDEGLIGGTKVTGAVWSFSVRPAIAKADPTLVGWWKLENEGSGTAVDYSGYDRDGILMGNPQWVEGYLGGALKFNGTTDYVETNYTENLAKWTICCWVTSPAAPAATAPTGPVHREKNYQFDWNHTNAVYQGATAMCIGGTWYAAKFGPLSGNTWYHLTASFDGTALKAYLNGVLITSTPAAGVPDAEVGTLKFGRHSTAAQFFNGTVDDVRVYSRALAVEEIQKAMQGDPLLASSPQPAHAANVDIRNADALAWTAGEKAVKHDVYFGKDPATVKTANTNAPEYQGRQTGTSFSVAGLTEFGGGTYAWRIDEVEADGTTIHRGNVWTFSVPAYLIVDEFETYNDDMDAKTTIFDTWIDGFTDGLSGSIVGKTQAPFAERTIIHSGKQAMPLDFNNTKTPFFSETVQTFSPLQDWTVNEVTDLSLWVRGNPVSFVDKGNGAFTVGASGHDIWDNADDFRFVYKRLSGDGSVTVKVESLVNTNAWAKAGVMIRESLDAGSAMAYMIQSYSSGASFGWRQTLAGTPGSATQTGINAPQWVKLTRTGNVFTAQYSADGKTWTDIKNATGQVVSTTIMMPGSVYIGLCTTSHNAAATTTAQYSGAATTGGVTGAWQQVWIGDDLDLTNGAASLYVTVEDSAGKTATATNATAVNAAAWTEWKIPLSSLTGVNLARVKKLYLGVGDKANPVPDGSGRVYIDDIRVTKP